MAEEMMVDVFAGTCVWYNEDKGYGFVSVDGAPSKSRNAFLHAKHILSGMAPLTGDRLMFELEWERDRYCAHNVERLQLPE